MSELQELLRDIVARLDAAGIPFMVAGSFASSAHGMPRTTQDLDLVIAPPGPASLNALVASLPKDRYYVDPDTAREALRLRAMFNVVDMRSGWKVDMILLKNRDFSHAEFARRQPHRMLEVPVFIASPEDTILAKLEWSKMSGGSERQRRDVAGILTTSGSALDREYVERWVASLGLREEWSAAEQTEV